MQCTMFRSIESSVCKSSGNFNMTSIKIQPCHLWLGLAQAQGRKRLVDEALIRFVAQLDMGYPSRCDLVFSCRYKTGNWSLGENYNAMFAVIRGREVDVGIFTAYPGSTVRYIVGVNNSYMRFANQSRFRWCCDAWLGSCI